MSPTTWARVEAGKPVRSRSWVGVAQAFGLDEAALLGALQRSGGPEEVAAALGVIAPTAESQARFYPGQSVVPRYTGKVTPIGAAMEVIGWLMSRTARTPEADQAMQALMRWYPELAAAENEHAAELQELQEFARLQDEHDQG